MDACANEAIPQWGKHNLISCVYLLYIDVLKLLTKLFYYVVSQHYDILLSIFDPFHYVRLFGLFGLHHGHDEGDVQTGFVLGSFLIKLLVPP